MTGDQPPFQPTQNLNQRLDIDYALQAAGLGVWELDPATKLVSWDDRCRSLFGLANDHQLSYEQAIGYIHPDDVARINQAVDWAMNPASDGVYDQTYRTMGADDGQLRWVRFYGRSYFSNTGQLYRFAGVAQEVTGQILAQQREAAYRQQAQRQQRIYEAIASSTPDLMYVFDLQYRFIYANPALLEMWGRSWEDSIGKGLLANGYELWHAQMHEREIDQVVATKQLIRGEVSFPHATLGKRMYDYVFAPVVNEKGEVEAVAGTTRDITDIKRAQEALHQADRRKDEFLAMLAHELRNPLAPIGNGLQLLAQTHEGDPTLSTLLPIMNRQMNHLRRMVDDLLDVSRISQGKIELHKRRIDLTQLVEQTLQPLQPLYRASDRQLSVQLPEYPLYVDGDATRLS